MCFRNVIIIFSLYMPLGSSPVLGLFGWISGFVGWGWGGVAGDSVARLSGRLSTRHSKGFVIIFCDLCYPLYAHMLLHLCKL